MELKQHCSSLFLLSLLIFSSLGVGSGNNNSIPAAFVFGDSTVDPGNNNYINTVFKSDFPPYGLNFPHQTPTGRFSNGRLTSDFIASYAGLKESIPPYLDPNLSIEELATGVSFASAGSGYDPQTATRIGVLGLSRQVEYFQEYKKRLEKMIGNERTEYIIANGVFIVSAGTNDIVDAYGFTPPTQNADVQTYLHFLLNQFKWFMQAIVEEGATKIAVVGLPPAGCLPIAITANISPIEPRRCVDSLSSIAKELNYMLQNELNSIQQSRPNMKLAFADIYYPLQDQINNPHNYGFEKVNQGCCGTGFLEGAITCNPLTLVCTDPSKYVFWDAIHPTERSYYYLFQSARHIVDDFIRS